MQSPLIPVLSLPALLLVCGVAYAAAPQYDERWYLVPGLEHISPSHAEGVLSGNGWQFALGEPLALRWDLEFGVVDYSLDFSDGTGSSADHTFYGAQGLWLFNGREREFTPFLLVGGGAHAQRISDVDSTKPYGTLGLGFTSAPWEWDGALRFGLQYLHTFGNGNYSDRLFSAGLMIPFGGTGPGPTMPYMAPAAPPPSPMPAAASHAAAPTLLPAAALPMPSASTHAAPPAATHHH